MTPTNDQLAMQVLTTAGQAKQTLFQAIQTYHQTGVLELQAGHDQLVTAHRLQNQLTARLADRQASPNVLGCHVLDTLMAVESNYDLVQALLSK
ncbi:PTS lactose/cellobiose transporter subunit IIA [Levilactobacillus suantsaii]|uniref:Uncharacterized protein n=1 Tax=Levilactobacillus suantsaii TaxID=2292255 RepID=A0A4Q0VFF6_9LACO|nr:PTS lactose/cellobiose transporter subunit IIA [Levilactobacillus suantsaii]QMU07040.1 PTS lactose/cellobiose transporter subunit IIA [Levilactobacillus suantsaii]RXI76513.1 hypothetical protein DXH47_10510 [Levilactobacillus suantsaii]